MIKHTGLKITLSILGAGFGWFAVVFQLILFLNNRSGSVGASLIQFFSYFTIEGNILAALCYTFLLFPSSRPGTFFSRTTVVTALAVYILVVGTVYNVILRFIWDPQGWQMVVDELLHTVNPLLFVFFWMFIAQHDRLEWRNLLPWLIYPLIYCFYTFIRGAFTGLYPYPFLDVELIGYMTAVINCIFVCLFFLATSLLFIFINRKFRPAENS